MSKGDAIFVSFFPNFVDFMNEKLCLSSLFTDIQLFLFRKIFFFFIHTHILINIKFRLNSHVHKQGLSSYISVYFNIFL